MTLSSMSPISHSLSAIWSRLSSRLLSNSLSPLSSLYILSPETPLRGLWAVYRPARVAVCGVEKHRVCLSHVSSLVSCLVSLIGSSLVVAAALLSALCLLCSARNCSARGSAPLAHHGSSRYTALRGLCVALLPVLLGSTWLLLCSLLSVLLACGCSAHGSSFLGLRLCSASVALLG